MPKKAGAKVVGCLLILFTLGAIGCGSGDESELRKQYAEMDAAVGKKDLAAYMAHLSPTFSATYALKGSNPDTPAPTPVSVPRDEFETALSEGFKQARDDATMVTELSKVSVSGDTATVEVACKSTDGSTPKVVNTMSGTDTWKKSGGAWKLESQSFARMVIDTK